LKNTLERMSNCLKEWRRHTGRK